MINFRLLSLNLFIFLMFGGMFSSFCNAQGKIDYAPSLIDQKGKAGGQKRNELIKKNFSPGVSVQVEEKRLDFELSNNEIDSMQAKTIVLDDLPSRLVLFVGQMSLIKMSSVSRVAVGNGKVVSANMLDKHNLLLTALDGGDSTLHVWDKGGVPKMMKIRVNISDNERAVEELQDLTSKMPGISIRRAGERIVIDGNNIDLASVERISMLAKLYPNTVNLATADRIRVDRMVELQVKFMEFSKSALDSLGVQWQSVADGFSFGLFSDISNNNKFRVFPRESTFSTAESGFPGTNPAKLTGGYLGLASTLSSKINLLVQRGSAFTLASPNLTTRSGGEAKFVAGGEFPLPSVGANGASSVSFKSYGILLNIKPTADAYGNISGSIFTEISNIDRTVAVQGIPGLATRRTDTEFNVLDGETIVLSGLVTKENSNDTSGLPGLRRLPFFGNLFKSDNDNDKETEVIIFVTPKIVDPSSNKNRIERMQQRRQERQNAFDNSIDENTKPLKMEKGELGLKQEK